MARPRGSNRADAIYPDPDRGRRSRLRRRRGLNRTRRGPWITIPRSLRSRRSTDVDPSCPRPQCLDELDQRSAHGRVGQVAILIEMLTGRPDHELGQGHDARTGEDERLAKLGLSPRRRSPAWAGAHDGHGLIAEQNFVRSRRPAPSCTSRSSTARASPGRSMCPSRSMIHRSLGPSTVLSLSRGTRRYFPSGDHTAAFASSVSTSGVISWSSVPSGRTRATAVV